MAPYIEGVVMFDGRVTLAEVQAMTDAHLRCELGSGRQHEFSGTTVMGIEPSGSGSTFRLRIEIMDR